MYVITAHAMARIKERVITAEELLAAMASDRVYEVASGHRILYDPASRCAVFFDPYTREVVTVFRLRKRQIKKWCSR